MSELYKRYRPKSLKTVMGQDAAIASLRSLIERNEVPHTILLTGPSGVGKTTLARILKKLLHCGDSDYQEINSADFRGIDMIREIRRHVNLFPMDGECRIWMIDEAHKLSNDAQNAFLKLLEDTPPKAYFILATTDAQKLIPTILTRCSEVKLKALSIEALQQVLIRVIQKEKWEVDEDVVSEIAEAAEGSARKALVILEQVGKLEDKEEQIRAIQFTCLNKDKAIELVRKLVRPRVAWGEVASVLKDLSDEDPEAIRHLALNYCRAILLKGGPIAPLAFRVIDVFSDNFYNSKQAGLAAACWEVVNLK